MSKRFTFFCLLLLSSAVTLVHAQQTSAVAQRMEKRAKDLIAQLTTEEKINQLMNAAPGVERLGIKPYDYWN